MRTSFEVSFFYFGGGLMPSGTVRIVLEGEQEYNAAVKRINSSTKELNSEMALLSEKYKETGDKAEYLKGKQEILEKKLELQKQKVEEARKAYELMKNELGENSEKTQKLATALNNAEAGVLKLEKAIKDNEIEKYGIGIKTVTDNVDKAGNTLQSFSGKTSGISTVALTAANAIGLVVANAAQEADELNTLSKITGVSTDELQKFKYASELVDVSVDTYAGSLKKLTKNMSEAQSGNSTYSDAFEQLGVKYQDVDGKLKSSNEVFLDTIDALGKVSNETERDTLAMTLMGKSATDLNPLIAAGSDELKRLGEEAEETGAVMSQDTLDSLNKLNDKIDTFKAKMSGKLMQTGANFLDDIEPIITNMIDVVEKLLNKFNALSEGEQKQVVKLLLFTSTLSKSAGLVGSFTSGLSSAINTGVNFVAAVKGGEGAMAAFNVVCNANPIGAVVTVLGLATAAFLSYNAATLLAGDSTETLSDRLEDVKSKYDNAKQSTEDSIASDITKAEKARLLVNDLKKLEGQTKLTSAQEEEQALIVKELNETIPDLNVTIDENTQKLSQNTKEIEDNITAWEKKARLSYRYKQLEDAVAAQIEAEDIEDEARKAYSNELDWEKSIKAKADLEDAEAAATAAKKETEAIQSKIDEELRNISNTNNSGKSTDTPNNNNTDNTEDEAEKARQKAAEEAEKARKKAEAEATQARQKAAEEAEKARQKAIEAAKKEELSLIKYYYDMGETSEAEYYSQLEAYRDKYFTKGSEEWRNYTLQIKKYNDELQKTSFENGLQASFDWIDTRNLFGDWDKFETNESDSYDRIEAKVEQAFKDKIINADEYKQKLEEIAKERLSSYNDRQNNSSEWISDRDFYDDWESYGTTKVESIQRMLDRCNEYYEKGLIDYKTYITDYKKLSKELYTAEKTAQEQAYSSISDSLDKLLAQEKIRIDAQISELNSQVSKLRQQYTTEDRNKKLSNLQDEADKYKNAGTIAGQEHYQEIVDQIDELNREAELEQLEQRNNEIIEQLNAEYAAMEQQKADILLNLEANQTSLNETVSTKLDNIIGQLDNTDISSIFSGLAKTVTSAVTNNSYTITNNNNPTVNNTINDGVDFWSMLNGVLRGL
jgi:hypothetical protein